MTDIFTEWLRDHDPEINRIHADEKARLAQEERIAKEKRGMRQRRKREYYTNALKRLYALTRTFILNPERTNEDKLKVIVFMRNIRTWTVDAHPLNQPALGVSKAHEHMHALLNDLSDDCSFFASEVKSLLDRAATATEADFLQCPPAYADAVISPPDT